MITTRIYTIAGDRYELTLGQMAAYRSAVTLGDLAGQAVYASTHFAVCRVATRAPIVRTKAPSPPAITRVPISTKVARSISQEDARTIDRTLEDLTAKVAIDEQINGIRRPKPYTDSEGFHRVPAGVVPGRTSR